MIAPANETAQRREVWRQNACMQGNSSVTAAVVLLEDTSLFVRKAFLQRCASEFAIFHIYMVEEKGDRREPGATGSTAV